MAARRKAFANGEFYHVYNRGVDKRTIFEDPYDLRRFFQSMVEFNTIAPIGSIYENSFSAAEDAPPLTKKRLVNIVAYCLNPNHFHLILEQVSDGGVSEFMKRLGGGYTMYFNNKHARSGVLFQGVFKSVHIETNEYLLHLSAYVNLNDCVHQLKLGGETSKLVASLSSWEEYAKESIRGICQKTVVISQFASSQEYEKFALSSLKSIQKRKSEDRELMSLLFEDLLGGETSKEIGDLARPRVRKAHAK